MSKSPLNEEQRTNKVRDQGKPDGLFRAAMDTIRHSHSVGQALRTAALAAGVMTDATCYAELLSQFYVTTNILEERLNSRKENSKVISQIAELGYHFKTGYEQDLKALVGDDWKTIVSNEFMTEPAKKYIEQLQQANDVELVAASFILWGPLVIGGGAALKPRVKKSFGEDATNVFTDVVGIGRGDRRKQFIECMDDIGDQMGPDAFARVVAASGAFMSLNNEMMMAVKKNPYWLKYVYATVGVVFVVTATVLYRRKNN